MDPQEFKIGDKVIITDVFYKKARHFIGREGIIRSVPILSLSKSVAGPLAFGYYSVRVLLKEKNSTDKYCETTSSFAAIKIRHKPVLKNYVRKLRITCKK